MEPAVNPVGTPAPATLVVPVIAPVAPVPAPIAAPAVPVTPPADGAVDPAWLKGRLDRERAKGANEALSAAGFATTDEAKAAGAAAKAAADANKTAEQRATEANALATTEKQRADTALAAVKEHAARQIGALTAEQQAAVKAVAGDDSVMQLRTIDALRPTWPTPATPAAGGETVVAPTTAPSGGAPNGSAPAPANARTQYEALRASNPFEAAAFAQTHPEVYEPKK